VEVDEAGGAKGGEKKEVKINFSIHVGDHQIGPKIPVVFDKKDMMDPLASLLGNKKPTDAMDPLASLLGEGIMRTLNEAKEMDMKSDRSASSSPERKYPSNKGNKQGGAKSVSPAGVVGVTKKDVKKGYLKNKIDESGKLKAEYLKKKKEGESSDDVVPMTAEDIVPMKGGEMLDMMMKLQKKKKILRVCANCRQEEPTPKTYMRCQMCKKESVTDPRYYCGHDCHKEDWKAKHKREHKEGNLPK
jgi:hypothetical protein